MVCVVNVVCAVCVVRGEVVCCVVVCGVVLCVVRRALTPTYTYIMQRRVAVLIRVGDFGASGDEQAKSSGVHAMVRGHQQRRSVVGVPRCDVGTFAQQQLQYPHVTRT